MFASDRACHHPINKKDIIPTPSQPMNNCSRLFAVTRMIIVIRKSNKYLKNRLILGSECIYHRENSIMDHVTNRATGINIIEKKSVFRLIEILNPLIDVQCQLEITVS